jgi:hypothetical protein
MNDPTTLALPPAAGAPDFTQPPPYLIRIYRNTSSPHCTWHVGICGPGAPRANEEHLGMAWDEMLGAVARLAVSPGGAQPLGPYGDLAGVFGAPNFPWRLEAELEPHIYSNWWAHHVRLIQDGRERLYRSLAVGEMLAVLTAATAPEMIRRGEIPFSFERLEIPRPPSQSGAIVRRYWTSAAAGQIQAGSRYAVAMPEPEGGWAYILERGETILGIPETFADSLVLELPDPDAPAARIQEIHVCHAAGLEPIALVMGQPPEDGIDTAWARRSDLAMTADAERARSALHGLPQGTLQRLTGLLLEDQAGLLRRSVFDMAARASQLPAEPPEGFRAAVAMTLERFNVVGPQYPRTAEVVAQLWATLQGGEEEHRGSRA